MAFSSGDSSALSNDSSWLPSGYKGTVLVVKFKDKPVFVNAGSLKEEYRCELCQEILLLPVQTPCRGRVCKRCISKKFGSKSTIKCPLPHDEYSDQEKAKLKCKRDGLVKNELKADLAAQSILAGELCFCINKPYGCDENYQWENLKVHEARCTKGPHLCKNPGCGEQTSEEEQLKHGKTCIFGTVECRYCKQPAIKKDLEKHYHDCSSNKAKCGTCKKPLHMITQMKVHKKISPSCVTSAGHCYFADYCQKKFKTARELSKHLTSESSLHLQAVTAQALLIEYSLSAKSVDTDNIKEVFDKLQAPLSAAILSTQMSTKDIGWETENRLSHYTGAGLERFKSVVEKQADLERKTQNLFSKFITIPTDQVEVSTNCVLEAYKNEINLAHLSDTMQEKGWSPRDGRFIWKITDPDMMKENVQECVRSAWFYTTKGHRVYIQARDAMQIAFHHNNLQLSVQPEEKPRDFDDDVRRQCFKLARKEEFYPKSVTFILLPRSILAQPLIRTKRPDGPGSVVMQEFSPKSVLTDPKYFQDGCIYIQCIINEVDDSNLRFVPADDEPESEDEMPPLSDEDVFQQETDSSPPEGTDDNSP